MNAIEKKKIDIHERAFDFGVRIVLFCKFLDEAGGTVNWNLSKQLLRAGTSIGANIEEAQAGQSTADFINKLNISLKEARETDYWIRIIMAAELVDEKRLLDLKQEAEEIKKILGAIIISKKRNNNKSPNF
jgi:four helix bundle protein